jgi:hypothetical protein
MSRCLTRWAVVALLAVPLPAARGDRPGEKPPPKEGPDPDPAWSFVTPTQSEFHVALVAKEWVLVLVVPTRDYPYHTAELPLKKTLKPTRATLHAGPDVWKYVRPSGGPATPPIPDDGKYGKAEVAGVEVTITTDARGREPDAHVVVDVSAFKIDGKERPAMKGLKLPVRGPYP